MPFQLKEFSTSFSQVIILTTAFILGIGRHMLPYDYFVHVLEHETFNSHAITQFK